MHLGEVGGFDGIDFTKSLYFKDGRDDIILIADYKVRRIRLFEHDIEFHFVQRAVTKAGWRENLQKVKLQEQNQAKRILFGQRKSPDKNELIGGHSPNINNDNPDYAVEVIRINPDGWSDEKIIESIKAVGNSSPIGVRDSDVAMLYREIIGGVQIEVIKMFDEFDNYILEFAEEDFAVDYWYDEGVDIAENMLHKFSDNDWKLLLNIIPQRTVEWQKRLAYCMHDGNNLNQLEVLLELAKNDDSELFEIVVDSLRSFRSKDNLNTIYDNVNISLKIKELSPKAGAVAKKIFKNFLSDNK